MNIESRALHYISRYAPSKQKMIQYLERHKVRDREFFLASLSYDETLMVDLWFRTFIALGKSRGEMIQKLQKKGFSKECILSRYEHFRSEIENIEDYKGQIELRIESSLGKGKSKREVLEKLCFEFPYFRDWIESRLDETDDISSLTKWMEKYKNKYRLDDQSERQKYYKALLSKGFSFRDIQSNLKGYYQ